ncbi:L-threonine dehydrogenase [Polycladidibacter hongkongensis]|uniref:L-threonine dehydrogenase n=1 Tax=Polycladidibacter hongkongensis TaxID=1647556 RepID=UPI000829595B|nr:L-threonine dehydrogenase [Pseudovibrio hongkongensis]
MTSCFFIPSVNMMGAGCLKEAVTHTKGLGHKSGLIVCGPVLKKMGVVDAVAALFADSGIATYVFSGVQPNPTIANVEAGVALLKQHDCDFVIALGGGSPIDCAKGIALVATNGGSIADYEGVDQSAKPQLPLVAINTTAGTASEMTRFCIITDESRHIKMAIVDKNTTPVLSVNDPELMLAKPPALTAATGMDALTHAIEAYVSTAATPITDAVAIKAIELISRHLRAAVRDGKNIHAREQMAYAQFMAGMAFNNASLGYVHAMAHQLGGFYDLPHGVCNAILLPHVERFNAAVCPKRLKDVAAAMGVDVVHMSAGEGAEAALVAIRQLSQDVGIPAGLRELDVKEDDLPTLAKNAMMDACGLTNPKQPLFEEVVGIYQAAM